MDLNAWESAWGGAWHPLSDHQGATYRPPGRNLDDEERRPEETVGGTTEGRPDETTPTYSRTHTHIHYYVHVHTFYSLSDTLSRSTSYSTVTTSDIYHVTRSFY